MPALALLIFYFGGVSPTLDVLIHLISSILKVQAWPLLIYLLWRGYSYFGRVTSFNKLDPKGSGMAATYFSTLEGLFLLWMCLLI